MFVHWPRMREQVLGQRSSCGGDVGAEKKLVRAMVREQLLGAAPVGMIPGARSRRHGRKLGPALCEEKVIIMHAWSMQGARPGAVVRLERTRASRLNWSYFGWVIGPLTWTEGLTFLWALFGWNWAKIWAEKEHGPWAHQGNNKNKKKNNKIKR